MKNLLAVVSLIAVVAMAVVSCQTYNSGEFSYYSSEKTEGASERVQQDGFIIKRVKPGDTLWGTPKKSSERGLSGERY